MEVYTGPATLEDAIGVLTEHRITVLTGAGISTDSGIPDYRGPGRPPHKPMTISQFRSSESARQRYWARSHLGWRHMAQTQPNAGHAALAELEARQIAVATVTQNVDGLHEKAGSRMVIDLHGRLDRVICLGCGALSPREALHQRLNALNPSFARDERARVLPDGDVDLADTSSFHVAPCENCGGVLKPDVVFFGQNVPRDRVDASFVAVDEADALLVAGSSLAVLSGLRFVRYAARQGKPIVIVNRGTTRADELATVKLDAGCSETLQALAVELP